MTLWSRGGYLAATAALAASGAALAFARSWGEPAATAVGLGTAWALQAPSFWRLAGTLIREEDATRDWLGGIALRLGGLGLLAAVGGGPAWPRRDLALSYVAALLVYLLLEAVWLFRLQPTARGREAGGARAGPPRRAGDDAAGDHDRVTSDERERTPDRGVPRTTEPPAR